MELEGHLQVEVIEVFSLLTKFIRMSASPLHSIKCQKALITSNTQSLAFSDLANWALSQVI